MTHTRVRRAKKRVGASTIHFIAGAMAFLMGLTYLVSEYDLKIGLGRQASKLAPLLIASAYLAFAVLVARLVRVEFKTTSIEFSNVLRRGVIDREDIDEIYLIDRWWTLTLRGLDVSSPCVVVKSKDGKRVKLIATEPVLEGSGRYSEISNWSLKQGLGPLRTRFQKYMDEQSEAWKSGR